MLMPTPAVALKIKKFRRRFGITAPNVVVRSHVPWQWYFLAVTIFAVLLVTVVWIVLQRNDVGLISDELESLRLEVRQLDEERLVLRSTAGTEKNLAVMERSAQHQLLSRVQALEAENAALMEDMLLFDKLIPVPGDEAVVRVENFRMIRDGGGRLRYRILLAYQPTKQIPVFVGGLQLQVTYKIGGKEYQLLFPSKTNPESNFSIDMRHFWRKEGVLELPPGSAFLRAEVRVLQGGKLKAKRIAQI